MASKDTPHSDTPPGGDSVSNLVPATSSDEVSSGRQRPIPKPRTRVKSASKTATDSQAMQPPSLSDTSMSMSLTTAQSDADTVTSYSASVSSQAVHFVDTRIESGDYDHGLKALRERRLRLKQERKQSPRQCEGVTAIASDGKPNSSVRETRGSSLQSPDPTNPTDVSSGTITQCPHCSCNLPLGLSSCYRCHQPVVRLASKKTDITRTASEDRSPVNVRRASQEYLSTSGMLSSATSLSYSPEKAGQLQEYHAIPKGTMELQEEPGIRNSDSDSDTESVCSTVSASSSALGSTVTEKTKLRARFPPFITTKQLYAHFTHCGFDETEVHIRRPLNHATGKPAGSATVIVGAQASDFISAVNNTLLLQKHSLKVELYHKKRKPRPNQKRAPKQKQGLPTPALNTGSTSPKAVPKAYRIFVGSGLPAYVNEQHIREHFGDLQHGITRVENIKDRETKQPKGFFFVTFNSQDLADKAVQNYHHSFLLGQHRLKVERQKERVFQPPNSGLVEPVVAQQPQTTWSSIPVVPQMNSMLLVDNLDTAISNDELKALINVSVVDIGRSSTHPLQCFIHFHNDLDATSAKNSLDGKTLLGKVVRAVIQKQDYQPSIPYDTSTALQPMRAPPPQQLHQGAGMHGQTTAAAGIPALMSLNTSHIGPFNQNPTQPPQAAGVNNPQYHSSYSQPSFDPYNRPYAYSPQEQHPRGIPPGGNIQLLKLPPEQWNQLMTVQTSGASVYQDIISPFRSNPNVKIEIEAGSCTLKITGEPNAVNSAYEHVLNHLSKMLYVTDRFRMEGLVNVYPQLPSNIFSKHGVSMKGFSEDSTVIHFDGPMAAKPNAWADVNKLLTSAVVVHADVGFPIILMSSLKRRFDLDDIPTYVKSCKVDRVCNQVAICSFDQSKHKQAMEVIHGSPFVNEVKASPHVVEELVSSQCLKGIEEQQSVSIQIKDESNKLVVSGFILRDVQMARKNLISLVKEKSTHRFSPEELKYLQFQYHHSPELFTDVPIEFKQGRIVGSPEVITKIVDGPLLAGLKWNAYSFVNGARFLHLITDHILRPLREKQNLNFVYIVDRKSPDSKKSRTQGVQKPTNRAEQSPFNVVIYSQDPTVFLQVCAALDDVNPTSRHYSFRYRESSPCVQSIKHRLESTYLVQIVQTERGAHINGLSPGDVQKCWDDIDDEIKSAVVTTKTLSSSLPESKYLKQKYAEELKLEYACEIFLIKANNELRAKGKLKDLEALENRVAEILESGVQAETFKITCKSNQFHMWRKWWIEIKKQKGDSDVTIEFSRTDRRQLSGSVGSESEALAEVQFEVIGTDSEQLQAIKETLCNQDTEERTIVVPARGATAMLNAKKKGQLKWADNLAVVLFIDTKANRVVLTSAKGLADDLDAAEEKVQNFVGNHTVAHENVISDEPVVGLVLHSKTKSDPYLKNATVFAKQHNVSVHPLKSPLAGLRISGTKADIAKVKTFLQTNILRTIESNVKQVTVNVNSKQSCLLSSPEFSRFESKLKDDYCVICSYPKLGKRCKAAHSAVLSPSSSAHPVQVDICRGSIIYESIDAIVNPANEDLQHVGGLAKLILDAAGQSIQKESYAYVNTNGKVIPGSCVALSAGALPCKKIIHAVGPRWTNGSKGEEQILYFTVYNSLQCASNEKLDSVAFPAISTGIFGVPEDVCARASLKAVQDYSQAFPNSTVSVVRFILFTPSAFQSFSDYFKSVILPSVQSSSLQRMVDLTPQASAVSRSSTGTRQWMWKDDNKSFSLYPPDVAAKIGQQYQVNPQGSFQCFIGKNSYVIDFKSMTQMNVYTGYKREIRLGTLPSQTLCWEYVDDRRSWSRYQPQDSQMIEFKYQSNSQCVLNIRGNVYHIDFASMQQINVQTNTRRSIRRVAPTLPPTSTSAVAEKPTVNPLPHTNPSVVTGKPKTSFNRDKPVLQDVTITLRGPEDSVLQAKHKFEEKLKFLFKIRQVNFPAALEDKLRKVVRKYNVSSSFESVDKGGKRGKPQKIITVEGLASLVDRAVTDIQEEIIKNQLDAAEDQEEEFPPEWEPQARTTQVFVLQQGNQERIRVEQLFRQTMPSSTIHQISRIQNKWLWGRYVFQRKRLGIKNGGNVNEMELFHGTRANDPKVIYENEDGFDMRYSAAGMWGQANYFAVNASYSHGYAHPTNDGYREMFLVKVLTGDAYDCPSTPSLRKPPMKAAGTSGEVSFTQVQYDTVTGVTNGSRVYMTYDNDKAYPAYLVKYT